MCICYWCYAKWAYSVLTHCRALSNVHAAWRHVTGEHNRTTWLQQQAVHSKSDEWLKVCSFAWCKLQGFGRVRRRFTQGMEIDTHKLQYRYMSTEGGREVGNKIILICRGLEWKGRARCLSLGEVQIVCQLPCVIDVQFLYLERCLLGCNVLNLAQICISVLEGTAATIFTIKCNRILSLRLCAIMCVCERVECDKERERGGHIDAFFYYQSLSPILQQLVVRFNAQSWKIVIRCVKERVSH